MAGLMLGALGGAGQELAKAGGRMQQGAIDAELENLRNENLLNRTKALEQFKMDVGNQQRVQMTERVGAAKTGLINAEIDNRYAKPVMGDTPLTEEQQAVLDQGLMQQGRDIAADRKTMEGDVGMDVKAALKTGDLSVKDAATLSQKDAASETRLAIAQMRTDALNAKTEAQLEAAKAKLEAAITKAGAGNTDFDKKIKLLRESGATPREIANFITERKQPSLEDLANGFLKADPNAGTKKALTPEAAYERAKALRTLTKSIGEEDQAETPAPAPAPKKPPAPAKDSAPKRLTFDPATGTFK